MNSRRPFDVLFERASTTVDKVYSSHKSAFKGWAAFFKQLGQISKNHSGALLKLSQSAGDHLGLKLPLTQCVKSQSPQIKSIISEMLYSMSILSQLHFNFSERMMEFSQGCAAQHQNTKKTKQHFMDAFKTTFPAMLQQQSPRQQVERQITHSLYQIIDKLEEDQVVRTTRTRDTCVLFYAITKKVLEKELETAVGNGARLSKMQIASSSPELSALLNQLRNLHNSYPGAPKLQSKHERIVQPMRSSLKMSRVDHNSIRIAKMKDMIKGVEQKAEQEQSKVLKFIESKYVHKRGLLSRQMESYSELSYYIKPPLISSFVYSMIDSYYLARGNDRNIRQALLSIRVRLMIGDTSSATNPTRSFREYLEVEYEKRSDQERKTIAHLINISMYHCRQLSETDLRARLKDVGAPLPAIDFVFDVWVGSVFLEILIETLFKSRDDEDYLVSNYAEIFNLIQRFGMAYLGLEPQLTLLLFLQRVGRVSAFRDQQQIQPNCQQLQVLLQVPKPNDAINLTDLTIYLRSHLTNVLASKLVTLYEPNTHVSLAVQILNWFDVYFRENTSLELIMKCVRLSGYRYLKIKDQAKALADTGGSSTDKLKALSQMTRDTAFVLIDQKILSPLSRNISEMYGMSLDSARQSIREQFFTYVFQILLYTLDTINTEGLTDKDGNALLLGVQLCKIDQMSPQPLNRYDGFFRILGIALTGMEGEYKGLLEQAKTTELWIVEENMDATQNCYDFCSLLAKPIEFMSNVLKQTAVQGQKSQFRDKFVSLVRLKLNEVLRTEVVRYVAFLESSLEKIDILPETLNFDSKRPEQPVKPTEEQLKQLYFSFKQTCKRLRNLVFIKQQITEIARDLIDPEVFGRIQGVFDSQGLQAELSKASSAHKQHLSILRKVASDITVLENRILQRIARGTINYYLRKLFNRLYFLPKIGKFDDVFGKTGPALSQHTLMNNREQIDDYLTLIHSNVPIGYYKLFFQLFLNNFTYAVRKQILNPIKFRPIPGESLFNYLNTDIANTATLIKRQAPSEEIVDKNFTIPLRRLIEGLKTETTLLFKRFQTAMINRNQQEADQIMALLWMRSERDKQAKDFIRKYQRQ